MAATNIARIDALFTDTAAPALGRDAADAEAVGAIQDLLNGHGARLPGILGTSRGVFGPQTEAAVIDFQTTHGLRPTGEVTPETLRRLVAEPAASPLAACGYLSLVLDVPWGGFTRLVALTAQFEAAGKFTAQNRNHDRAGLSFGIIQWAQKPGRLTDILRAFQRAKPDDFVRVFGGGDASLAADLVAHTRKPKGGLDSAGHSTDPRFELVDDAWNARFLEAGRDREWQKIQLAVATAAFRVSCDAIRGAAPAARSERAMAFLLDVANQHGDGGMQSICKAVATAAPALSEPAFLEAVESESVRRVVAQFGATSGEAESTRERRRAFRKTPLLSDAPFVDTAA
jgi:hypothetical protein